MLLKPRLYLLNLNVFPGPGPDEKCNRCNEGFSHPWFYCIGIYLMPYFFSGYLHALVFIYCLLNPSCIFHDHPLIAFEVSYCLIVHPWQLSSLQYRRMDFEEFCAAALSVHQLEALDRWEQHARCAYELFEKDGNRAIVIEELASVSRYFNLLELSRYCMWLYLLSRVENPMNMLMRPPNKNRSRSLLLGQTGLTVRVHLNYGSGTRAWSFDPTSCRSPWLDKAHGWEAKLPRICQIVAWRVQPYLCEGTVRRKWYLELKEKSARVFYMHISQMVRARCLIETQHQSIRIWRSGCMVRKFPLKPTWAKQWAFTVTPILWEGFVQSSKNCRLGPLVDFIKQWKLFWRFPV